MHLDTDGDWYHSRWHAEIMCIARGWHEAADLIERTPGIDMYVDRCSTVSRGAP